MTFPRNRVNLHGKDDSPIYRFWRDLGYGIGALGLGLVASAAGSLESGFWFVAASMAASAAWLAAFYRETRPGNPAQSD